MLVGTRPRSPFKVHLVAMIEGCLIQSQMLRQDYPGVVLIILKIGGTRGDTRGRPYPGCLATKSTLSCFENIIKPTSNFSFF